MAAASISKISEAPAQGHELTRFFREHGLPLSQRFCDMLFERPEHRTERRGCGFTQATRVLATAINSTQPNRETLSVLFDRAAFDLRSQNDLERTALAARREIAGGLHHFESRMLAELVMHCVLRDGGQSHLAPATPYKIPVGTCPLAEEYFLEIAYGRVRRGGTVNIVLGHNDRPVLLEKCGIGESHSCISIAEFSINGVDVPIGALIAIERDETAISACRPTANLQGRVIRGSDLVGLRFLRLTTLSVPPSDRRRAFTAHFDQQVRAGLFSPETTTIQQLASYAREQVS